MRIRVVYFVLSVMLILFCKPEPVVYTEADENEYKHDKFHFDGTKIPVPGITTESNLLEMFPEGPSRIKTFKRKINKKLFGKSFPIGKIYQYLNTYYDLEEDGNMKSYSRNELLSLVVFLDNGIVQDYVIDHWVRSSNGEQVIGRFHRMPLEIRDNEIWPGSQKDAACYWLQRADRDKYINSDELSCDIWVKDK